MASYYDSNKATIANARSLKNDADAVQHFPSEGLYLGDLAGGNVEIPALYDLNEKDGLCFFYKDDADRARVNQCIERLVWRLALCVPSNLCDLILYNGGAPGDAFSVHTRINKYVFGERSERVFFDSSMQEFSVLLNEVYASIVERMSTIRMAGKKNLVELNESLGRDARLKYQFIFLTDFPRHMRTDVASRLAQIIEAGSKAGIYVIMSWDMNADFADGNASQPFNPQPMLSNMALLLPHGDNFVFQNTGHDEVFNRFSFQIDCEPLQLQEIESCLQQIDIAVAAAKKAAKPTILKQDFDTLEETPYEPVMSEISVTVGLDVVDKRPVTVRFNSKDYIHGFILGRSGSGKSVLLNNIITSAILKYSPQDLMLYLMDFKGVEFNRYRGVKHIKAVLVDNKDPQMTLEVLRELKEENDRRAKLWQKENVSSIDGYNRKHPDNRLPQILFVADECQVMFREDTQGTERIIQQEITKILDTIATQGRSQGIHMLFATQQLDGANISGQVLKNLTECFLMMSAPGDSERLVPDSSTKTSRQMTGLACYYHDKTFQAQTQTFFATDEELAAAKQASQKKAADVPSNGEHYFAGSEVIRLNDDEKNLIAALDAPNIQAVIGHSINIKGGFTAMPLRRDFSENILFMGVNKEEQTVGVAVNALETLVMSAERLGQHYDVKVIDCYTNPAACYRRVLERMQSEGLCQIVERQQSGIVLNELANNVRRQTAEPTLLLILGSERYVEMKRNMPLLKAGTGTEEPASGFNVSTGVVNLDFFCDDNGDTSAYEKQIEEQARQYATGEDEAAESVVNTFPEALRLILDEGPMQGVHVLSQVDKPMNILFEDYPDQTMSLYRHKVILHSENKYLMPMRFSTEIDVEILGEDEENIRAYYYPEDGMPQLFKPYWNIN